MMTALTVLMTAVPFYAEQASAIELINGSGLLAVLKKNQVVSERDLVAIKNEYPKLEIKGSFQFQYINSADPVSGKINEMDLRRFNLTIASQVTDKLSLLIEPEYGNGLPSLRDAYIAYKSPVFGIYAGNHRVPFSAEALQNDINLRFVERSLASQISPDRLVGVSVFKKIRDDKTTIQAGVWNSKLNSKAESNLINNKLADNQIFSANSGSAGNNIFIKAFRIGSSLKGRNDFYSQGNGFNEDENFNKETRVNWGFSYYNSSAATTNNPTAGSTGINGSNALEADLSLRFKSLSGEFEYAKRNLDWWPFNVNALTPVASTQNSYSLQASALLTENLSIALRQESFVYDGTGKILKGAYGQDQDNWLTLGLNYYVKEQNTKIQINYILKNEGMPTGVEAPKNNTTLIQATAYF